MGKARFIGISAVGGRPIDIVADDVPTPLDPAMIILDSCRVRFNPIGRRIGEEACDVVIGGRPVGFEGKEIITAAPDERLGNG